MTAAPRTSDTDSRLVNARAYLETLKAPPVDGPRGKVEDMIIGGLRDAIEQCADAIDEAASKRRHLAEAELAVAIQRQTITEAIQHLQGLAHVRTATAAAAKAIAAEASKPAEPAQPATPPDQGAPQ